MHVKGAPIVKVILIYFLVLTLIFSGMINVSAEKSNWGNEGAKLENLDRGLIAASTSEGVFLSWRLLASEVTGYSKTGLTGANFNVYRDGKKIATVKNSTNYLDESGRGKDEYYVKVLVDGKEVHQSSPVTPWENSYYDLPLQKPENGVTPDGVTYSYHANDMSVGDVDGDGQYEFFVKWDPTNSKDVSQVGYTGKTYIDCYEFDGSGIELTLV